MYSLRLEQSTAAIPAIGSLYAAVAGPGEPDPEQPGVRHAARRRWLYGPICGYRSQQLPPSPVPLAATTEPVGLNGCCRHGRRLGLAVCHSASIVALAPPALDNELAQRRRSLSAGSSAVTAAYPGAADEQINGFLAHDARHAQWRAPGHA